MKNPSKWSNRSRIEGVPKNPMKALLTIYSLIVLAGSLLLSLPCAQKAPTAFIDNLFSAVSAVSTTGLASVSTSDNYNFFGQIIILLLIQVGGIHYMTFASFVVLAGRKKDSKLNEDMVRGDFGLPDDFDVNSFIRSVAIFSFAVEALAVAPLYYVFQKYGVVHPLWNAIFHSVSAFCTAGFSLFNTSLEQFSGDGLLNMTIILLSCLGACGFIVITDYWQKWTRKKSDVTFTTKVIICFSGWAIFLGTALLFFTNAFGSGVTGIHQIWLSLFQSMTALTTVGFDTFPIFQMSHSAVYLLVILMVMGASPAGTGGGIKSTTIIAVVAQTVHTLRGKTNVTFLDRQIPTYRLRIASANFVFYIFILAIGAYLLSMVESSPIFDIIFEAASALGTVGLSMGITAGLSLLGKLIIICLMFIGRIGPLTIGLTFLSKKEEPDNIGWHEDVVVG